MKLYEKHVQRGAAFLDEKRPRWWDGKKKKTINLETLDLGSPWTCTLGQLWGGTSKNQGSGFPFTAARFELGLSFQTLSDYGFVLLNDRPYKTLTRRWVEEIERRRA